MTLLSWFLGLHLLTGAQSAAFPTSADQARAEFAAMSARFDHGRKISIPLPGKANRGLSIDALFLPAKGAKHLFVLSAGIHGPETYAGHAIQMQFLQNVIEDPKSYPFNILVIHSINPYGFKHFQRTNSRNVDLNRNFAEEDDFSIDNNAYANLKNLLNPPGPGNASWISRMHFYTSTLWYLLRYGKRSILESLGGQYEDVTGLYYGGKNHEPETQIVTRLLRGFGDRVEKIYHVDLHTGFGERGRLHFFGTEQTLEGDELEAFQKVFQGLSVDTGRDENFYATTGDLVDWTWKSFKDKTVVSMVFEFGTLDSHTTHGGLRSLWITRLQNQGRQRGFISDQDHETSRRDFEELFNPQDAEWRRRVLEQAEESLHLTLQRFREL